jgi:hypothetical protein
LKLTSTIAFRLSEEEGHIGGNHFIIMLSEFIKKKNKIFATKNERVPGMGHSEYARLYGILIY